MKNRLLSILFAAVFALLIVATAANAPINTDYELIFKIKTVAICEEKPENIQCHDELLINCGNDEYILPKGEKTVNCGNIVLQAPSVTAFAVFDKDWEDPRYIAE